MCPVSPRDEATEQKLKSSTSYATGVLVNITYLSTVLVCDAFEGQPENDDIPGSNVAV